MLAPEWWPGSGVKASCSECSFQPVPMPWIKCPVMDKYGSPTCDVQASKVNDTLPGTSWHNKYMIVYDKYLVSHLEYFLQSGFAEAGLVNYFVAESLAVR